MKLKRLFSLILCSLFFVSVEAAKSKKYGCALLPLICSQNKHFLPPEIQCKIINWYVLFCFQKEAIDIASLDNSFLPSPEHLMQILESQTLLSIITTPHCCKDKYSNEACSTWHAHDHSFTHHLLEKIPDFSRSPYAQKLYQSFVSEKKSKPFYNKYTLYYAYTHLLRNKRGNFCINPLSLLLVCLLEQNGTHVDQLRWLSFDESTCSKFFSYLIDKKMIQILKFLSNQGNHETITLWNMYNNFKEKADQEIQLELIETVLNNKADINACFNNKTLLHEACIHANYKLLDLLLVHKADVNKQTSSWEWESQSRPIERAANLWHDPGHKIINRLLSEPDLELNYPKSVIKIDYDGLIQELVCDCILCQACNARWAHLEDDPEGLEHIRKRLLLLLEANVLPCLIAQKIADRRGININLSQEFNS